MTDFMELEPKADAERRVLLDRRKTDRGEINRRVAGVCVGTFAAAVRELLRGSAVARKQWINQWLSIITDGEPVLIFHGPGFVATAWDITAADMAATDWVLVQTTALVRGVQA